MTELINKIEVSLSLFSSCYYFFVWEIIGMFKIISVRFANSYYKPKTIVIKQIELL